MGIHMVTCDVHLFIYIVLYIYIYVCILKNMHIIHHHTISYYIIIMSVDRLGEASATFMKQVKGKAGR